MEEIIMKNIASESSLAEHKKSSFTARDLAFTALMTVIIAVCSWISVPAAVPFTMQTLGVFCALGLLGGKRGFFAVLTYIILGAAGVPVFAEFTGGIGILFTQSGGYITGFLALAAVYWLITNFFGEKILPMIIGMTAGTIVCYAFGTAWFMYAYARDAEKIGLATALGWCVFPFIIPDAVKMALAVILSRRLSKYVKD